MAKAVGEWIGRAQELIRATESMDKTARTRFLKARAEAGHGSTHTAHRQMVALRWLQENIAKFGLGLDRVVCPYTTVEALAMLKTERPDQAAEIAKDALQGRMTSREVLRLSSLARARSHRPEWPSSWAIFLMDEIGSMVPHGKAEILDRVDWMSEAARILQVDVEWVPESIGDELPRRYAIFLSPRLPGAFASTFSEVFKALMLARHTHDLVCFVTYDSEEIAFVERHERLFATAGSAELVVSADFERIKAALEI